MGGLYTSIASREWAPNEIAAGDPGPCMSSGSVVCWSSERFTGSCVALGA
jgi:hypothetical protein